jgi:hypothetical protein
MKNRIVQARSGQIRSEPATPLGGFKEFEYFIPQNRSLIWELLKEEFNSNLAGCLHQLMIIVFILIIY